MIDKLITPFIVTLETDDCGFVFLIIPDYVTTFMLCKDSRAEYTILILKF